MKPGLTPVLEYRDLRLTGHLVQPSGEASVSRRRVRCLFGRGDDRHATAEHLLELRQYPFEP